MVEGSGSENEIIVEEDKPAGSESHADSNNPASNGTHDSSASSSENESTHEEEAEESALISKREPSPVKERLKSLAYHSIWLLPAVNAIIETSKTAKGLRDNNYSYVLIYIASGTSFLGTLGIAGISTVTNIRETATFIKDRDFPPRGWGHITPRTAIAGAVVTGAIMLGVVSADGVLDYFFVNPLPQDYPFLDSLPDLGWKIATFSIVGLSAIGRITSEGFETYKTILQWKNCDFIEYKCPRFKKISLAIGAPLGVLGSLQDILYTFAGICDVFSITTKPAIYYIAAASTLTGIADFSLQGKKCIENIDQAIHYLTEMKKEPVKDALAFITALAAAGLLSYALKELTVLFGEDFADTFGLENVLTDPVIEIASYSIAAHDVVNFTGSLCPFTYSIFNTLEKGAKSVWNSAYNRFSLWCCGKTDEEKALLVSESDSAYNSGSEEHPEFTR